MLSVVLVATLRAAEVPVVLAELDRVVEQARKEFEVPGIAVAIVRDGTVLAARGYGVRERGKPELVDAHTLFAIASNTKAFTAAALAILVDEKKIAWNDRVAERLPWFQMSDPYVTREMSIRDLLVHRSGLGLGAGDLLFWPPTTYTTEDVVRRLRFVPLNTSFRANYAYDNVLYAVAELTLREVAGQPWSAFVRERIFAPVGMSDSKTSASDLRPGDNVATGHAKFDFTELRPVPQMAWDNNLAAGGIQSSVHDLAKWLLVQLDGGRLPKGDDGKDRRLFSEARQREMWSLVTPMPIGPPSVRALAPLVPNFRGYGLGWNVNDYRGKKIVSHSGGWPGQVSRVTLVPEAKLGIVVLTNQEEGAAFQAVTYRVLDALLDVPPTDWVAAYVESVKKGKGNADESWQKHVAARDAASRPSLALAKYAGTYRDVWYGDVGLALEGEKLVMRFSKTAQLVGELEHWQHDTFIVKWRDRGLNADAFVTFALTPDGAIDGVKMEAVSPLTDFSFDFHDLKLKPVGK